MKDTQYLIEKSSGDLAQFSEEKLVKSLLNSGASEEQALLVLNEVKKHLANGYSTRKIFKLAFKLLKKYSRQSASKYKLKEGIMELGPAGFAFEKFIAELMSAQGYRVEVGSFVKGRCVKHEIDVIAKNENQTIYIECKYHNLLHIKCDVKIPLYIRSRYNDILEKNDIENFEGWLVTNTKFSEDAFVYGTCAGLTLMSWDEPKGAGLKTIIDQQKLFPITCLTLLTKEEKEILLNKGIVLVKTLHENKKLLAGIIQSSARLIKIEEEITNLCS
jgi:hypothetical protein